MNIKLNSHNSSFFLCSRQPNEQARVVAPVITGAKLKLVAQSENASNMIIVRHPFDRWSKLTPNMNIIQNLLT